MFDFADYDTSDVARSPLPEASPAEEAAAADTSSPSFSLAIGPPITTTPRARSVPLVATIERRGGFEGVVTLAQVSAAPTPGFVVDLGVSIATGASSTSFQVAIGKDAPLGETKLAFQGKSGALLVDAAITIDVTGEPGELDTPFGDGGIVRTSFGAFAEANALLLDPSAQSPSDDRVIVVGSTSATADAGASPSDGGTGFAMARYLVKNGTLDTTFGSQGRVVTPTGVGALAVARQGAKILVAGGEGKIVVARYQADGVLDTTFGESGIVTIAGGTYANGIAVRPDASIVIGCGMPYQGKARPGVCQLLANGPRDNAFGNADAGFGGDLTSEVQGHGVVLAPDGTAVFARPWIAYPITTAGLTGLPQGYSATTFFGTPRALVHLDGGFDAGVLVVGDSTIQPDGLRFAAAKLRYGDSQGKGAPGQFVHDYIDIGLEQSVAMAVAVDAAGRFVYAGWSAIPPTGRGVRVARALPNGDLDVTFGAGGAPAGTTLTSIDTRSEGRAVVITRSGKIIVAGFSETSTGARSFAIARYVQ